MRKKIPKQVQLLISLSENKWEENKNFIQPAILGISRWLPFEENFFQKGVNFWRFSLPTKWRDKYFSWIGLVLDLPDAYQMGEKFSKPFIKTAISCSTTWGEKYFFKILIFFAFPWSTLWGKKFFWEWLPKRPLPVGISREKNYRQDPKKHPLSFLT